jgi:hypothetical protein
MGEEVGEEVCGWVVHTQQGPPAGIVIYSQCVLSSGHIGDHQDEQGRTRRRLIYPGSPDTPETCRT